MPKSKVRKKSDAPTLAHATPTPSARQLAPSPRWYPIVMVVVLLVGLAWLVTYYMTNSGTDPKIPLMGDIGGWNFAVGFGVLIVGLGMAVKWR
ncbi:MAG TPA: cell division protein CrgA [Jatrophihabitans sp.]